MGWTIYRSSERLSIVQQSDRRSCRRDVPSRASPDSLPKQGNAHSLSALKLKLSGGRPSSSGVTSGGSPGVADAGLVCVSDVFVQTARTWVRDPCSIDRSWLNTGLLMPAARKLRGMPLRRNGGGGGGEVEASGIIRWRVLGNERPRAEQEGRWNKNLSQRFETKQRRFRRAHGMSNAVKARVKQCRQIGMLSETGRLFGSFTREEFQNSSLAHDCSIRRPIGCYNFCLSLH